MNCLYIVISAVAFNLAVIIKSSWSYHVKSLIFFSKIKILVPYLITIYLSATSWGIVSTILISIIKKINQHVNFFQARKITNLCMLVLWKIIAKKIFILLFCALTRYPRSWYSYHLFCFWKYTYCLVFFLYDIHCIIPYLFIWYCNVSNWNIF